MSRRPSKPEPGDAVMIRWVDSVHTMSGWMETKLLDFEVPEIITIGILAHDSKEVVAVVQSVGTSGEDSDAQLNIPREVVRDLEVLRKAVV